MATIKFLIDVDAPSATKTFDAVKARLDKLDASMKRTRELSISNKDAAAKLASMQIAADRLRDRVDKPMDVTLRGAATAEARLLAMEASADRLNEKLSDTKAPSALSGMSFNPGLVRSLLLAAPVIISFAGAAAGAAAGLAGGFVTAGLAAAAYGTVAKSVLSQSATAAQAVSKAQDTYNAAVSAGVPKAAAQATLQKANAVAQLTYNAALASGTSKAKALAAYHLTLAKNQAAYNAATSKGTYDAKAYATEQQAIAKAYQGMSPAQIQLSKQVGGLSDQWGKFRKSVTPLIASSLQPWLTGITTGLQSLKSAVTPMGPAVHDLGTQFATLMDSSVFRSFAAWVGTSGARVTRSAGGAILDLITGLTFILPKFSPLINEAAGGIGKWGDEFVKWSASQKAANEIQSFLNWFHTNGPVVGQLVRNMGGTLKALAPGLGPASTAELNVISGFFGFIASLPPGLAKPLTEVAGILLTLNKLGVVKTGIQLTGMGKAGAAGAATGLWGKVLPGVSLVGGVLVATIAVNALTGAANPHKKGENGFDNPFGADPKSKDPSKQGVSTWAGLGNLIEHIFDNTRHAVASAWDATWNNTIGRLNRGSADTIRYLTGWEHDVAHWFDLARHAIAASWNTAWANTVGRTSHGITQVMLWLGTLTGRLGGLFSKSGSWLVKAGEWIIDGLLNGLKWVWNRALWPWMGRIGGWVTGLFGKAGSWLVRGGQWIIDGLLNGIKRVWNEALWPWVTRIGGWIKGLFSRAGSWLRGDGWNLVQGLFNGITGRLKGIGSWVKNNIVNPIINWVKHHFGIKSPSTVFHGIGFNMIAGLLRGIIAGDPLGAIKKIFGSAPKALAGLLEHGLISAAKLPGKAISALKGLGSSVLSHLGSVLGGAGSDVLSLLGGLFSSGGGGNAANEALGKKMAAVLGWTGNQWSALKSLWMGESGWSTTAYNAASGATGIPQSLPGSKMASAGADWRTNPATQIKWGLGYIADVYGNPANAYSKWLSRSPHWYAKGLAGQIFSTPTLIGVGEGTRPEKVTVTPLGANYGGSDGAAAPLIGTVNISPQEGPTVDEAMGALLFTMRRARQAGYPRR